MQENLPLIKEFFSFWQDLSSEHKDDLLTHAAPRLFKKGDMILPYKGECLGLMLVQKGQFRAFVLSPEGKEITLYRLFDFDVCLFSASCIMNNIQFDIHIEAEKDTNSLLIPASLYERLMNQSAAIANFTNELMSSRFSDVMWTLEQVLFKSMDARIARVLLEYASIEGTGELYVTHEAIARDVGTAREVVTRMLKYLSSENILSLGRGKIKIIDIGRLSQIAN